MWGSPPRFFSYTGFNVTTALMVSAAALAILQGSLFFAALGLLAYTARDAFAEELYQYDNGVPVCLQLLNFVAWLHSPDTEISN